MNYCGMKKIPEGEDDTELIEDTIGVVFLQLKHNLYGVTIMICVHPIIHI
jgi:hypothetical protein